MNCDPWICYGFPNVLCISLKELKNAKVNGSSDDSLMLFISPSSNLTYGHCFIFILFIFLRLW